MISVVWGSPDLLTVGDVTELLGQRITYHVPSLDPTTGRTVTQVVESYETDAEPRVQAAWLRRWDSGPLTALAEYARHTVECDADLDRHWACTCGRDAARAALQEVRHG